MKEYINATQIAGRVEEIAAQIVADYEKPPVMVGILNGAVQFMMDLIAQLPPAWAAELCYDFVDLSSYAGTQSSGQVQFGKDLVVDIAGQDVLVVDGIVDTGLTLHALLQHLKKAGPRTVKVCTLLDKSARRQHRLQVDYSGFAIEDLFVVGYGMDFDQRYRALPYIGIIET